VVAADFASRKTTFFHGGLRLRTEGTAVPPAAARHSIAAVDATVDACACHTLRAGREGTTARMCRPFGENAV